MKKYLFLGPLFLAGCSFYSYRHGRKLVAPQVHINQPYPKTYSESAPKGKPSLLTLLDSPAKEFHESWLEKNETYIWQMLSEYGLTKERYKKLAIELKRDYDLGVQDIINSRPEGQTLSEETLQIVNQVAADFNLNSGSFMVKSYVDSSISPACVTGSVLFIDEELLGKLSENGKMFVIGHEMQHIIQRDDLLGYVAQNVLPKGNFKSEDHPFNLLRRFQEMRADIYTIAHAEAYAHGQIEFLEYLLKIHGEGRGISHPKIASRIDLGKQILNFYGSEEATRAA